MVNSRVYIYRKETNYLCSVEAQSGLATTLLKLNTGLVDIISGFLTSKSMSLDYVALASLSDVSRVETKNSLTRLCQRLSRNTLDSNFVRTGSFCGHLSQKECLTNKCSASKTFHRPKNEDCRKSVPKGPNHSHGSNVVVAPVDGIVKNRHHRKRSTTSTSSRSSASSSDSKAIQSSPVANIPQLTPVVPLSISVKPNSKQRHHSDNAPMPDAINVLPPIVVPVIKQPARPHRIASSPDIPRSPKGIPRELPFNPSKLPPTPPPEVSPKLMPSRSKSMPFGSPTDQANDLSTIPSRHQDKRVESFYSFASDSTKLGEIPLHKWVTPFDFETMDRVNKAAASQSSSAVSNGTVSKSKGRPRLLARLFGKSPMKSIAEA